MAAERTDASENTSQETRKDDHQSEQLAAILAREEAARARLRPRRRGIPTPLRWCGIAAGVLGGLAMVAMLALLYLANELDKGPIRIAGLGEQISAALQRRVSSGQIVEIGPASIEKSEHGPALALAGLSLKAQSGEVILSAPKAVVSLDPLALLTGSVTPKRLDVVGLALRLSILPDGTLAVSAGDKPFVLGPVMTRLPSTTPENAPGSAIAAPAAPAPANASPAALEDHAARAAMRPLARALRNLVQASTGAASPLGVLKQVGVRQGKLVFEDQLKGATTTFDDLDITMTRTGEQARLLVSARGPNGRWSMQVDVSGAGEGYGATTQTLDVRIDNLSFDDIAMIAGARERPVDLDSPFSMQLRLGASHDGEFTLARGAFKLGRGMLAIRDPDQEPILIESVTGAFQWDDERRQIVVEPTRIVTAQAEALMGGTIAPPLQEGGPWAIRLASAAPLRVHSDRKGETTREFARLSFEGHYEPDTYRLTIGAFKLAGPQMDMNISGHAILREGQRQLQLSLQSARTSVRAVLRVWPTGIAAHLRLWLLDHLQAGTLESGRMEVQLDEPDLIRLSQRVPIAADRIRGEYELSNAFVDYLPGAPPMRDLRGRAKFDAHRTEFTATGGHLQTAGRQRVDLTGGTFTTQFRAQGVNEAKIHARLAGSVDILAKMLGEPGIRQYVAINLDPSTLKGKFDGELNVGFLFGERTSDPATRITAEVNASQLSIERLFGKERLEGGTLKVNVDGQDVSAKGAGRIFGAPANLSIEKKGRGDVLGTIVATLDDAARRKMGWSGDQISGPVQLKVAGPLGGGAPKGMVELDLTRATIANVPQPLAKPPGRSAKASFNLSNRPEGTSLQGFSYQSGAVLARGVIELDKSGGFSSASLSTLKLSPGDDMRADIKTQGTRLQIVARGASLDLRPHLAAAQQGSGGPPGKKEGKALDLDIEARLATGHNNQVISGFKLNMSETGGALRRFEFSGRSGRAPIRGQMNSGRRLEISTSDGGALLSFVDIYRRMEGGQLRLIADIDDRSSNGVLSVTSFVVRNEPALRRLVTEGVLKRDAQGRTSIDLSAVEFSRLNFAFAKSNARLTIRDGILSGPTVGTTLAGSVDFAADQVNMQGTFVPAYGLNNMFSQIPLFGPILGGGRNEGLLGVNFRVTGKASSPYLTINPLSAIAPGFLRKIFGAASMSGQPGQNAPGMNDVPPSSIPAAPANRTNGPINLAPQR